MRPTEPLPSDTILQGLTPDPVAQLKDLVLARKQKLKEYQLLLKGNYDRLSRQNKIEDIREIYIHLIKVIGMNRNMLRALNSLSASSEVRKEIPVELVELNVQVKQEMKELENIMVPYIS